MTVEFIFDPPLCVPENGGTAKIDSAEIEIVDGRLNVQPPFLQVEVCDGSEKRLALGLFQHVGNGLYRLIDGSACTGDGKTGMRIERR